MILLHLKIGDLRIRVWFGGDDTVAVNVCLERSVIDKYIRRTFPVERKLVFWHSRPVNIIVSATKTANAGTVVEHTDSQPSSAPLANHEYHRIVIAKAVILALHAHLLVLMESTDSRKRVIKILDNCANRALLHVAKRMANVILNKPFRILLTN